MRVHLTRLNGHAASSVAQIAQHMVSKIGSQLGYTEMGVYSYYGEEEPWNEKSARLDGIISGLGPGDAVIYQFPTWNGTNFDEALVGRIKAYGARLVIFVHDYIPVMYAPNAYLKDQIITIFNQAEVLIVPSKAMYDLLVEHGLTVKKYVVQGIWDHPTTIPQREATFKKEVIFLGSEERFTFIKDWTYDLPMRLYTLKAPSVEHEHLHYEGYLEDAFLLDKLSQGGFGLIWHSDDDQDYVKVYTPYKLGTYLAAGIPVVVKSSFSHAEYLKRHHLGLVADTIEDAKAQIDAMTEETYRDMVASVRNWNPLLREGYNMQRVLTEAVSKTLSDGWE